MPEKNKRFSLKSQELKDKLRDFSNRKPNFSVKTNFDNLGSKGLSGNKQVNSLQQTVDDFVDKSNSRITTSEKEARNNKKEFNNELISSQLDNFAINLARAKDLTKKAKAFDTFKDTFTKGGLPTVPFSESGGRGPKNLQRKYPYLSSIYDLSAGPDKDPFIKTDVSGRPVDNISGMTRYNEMAFRDLDPSVISTYEDDAKLAYDISQNAQSMIQDALASGDLEAAEKMLSQTLLNISGDRKYIDKSGKEYDYAAKWNKEVPVYEGYNIVPHDIPTRKDFKGTQAENAQGKVANPGSFAIKQMMYDIHKKHAEGKADYNEDLDLQAYRAVQRAKMRNAARRIKDMDLGLNQSSFDERSGE